MNGIATLTVTFMLCAGCTFPHNAESRGNNVATFQEVTNRKVSESVAIRPSSVNKDLSSSVTESTKSSTSEKRNQRDIIEHRRQRLIRDDDRYINTSNPSVEISFLQKSREWDEETNNTGMYKYYTEDSSEISESSTVQERGRKEECHNDRDCETQYLKNSYCTQNETGNFCQCPSGYIVSKSECLPKAELGDPCKLTAQCPSESGCINDTCLCKNGYIREGFSCVQPHQSCERAIHCPQFGVCFKRKCHCYIGETLIGGKCVRGYKDECYNNNDCQENFQKGSICLNTLIGNKCKCPPGFMSGTAGCLPIIRKEECQSDTECESQYLKNSYCAKNETGNFCECRYGEVAGESECLHLVPLGLPCKESVQCSSESHCINGTCDCMRGYIRKYWTCMKLRIVKCQNDSDCEREYLKNSYCAQDEAEKICQCPSGYISSKSECLPKVELGEHCKLTAQCPSQSGCINETCLCKNGYIREGLACVKPRLGSCHKYFDCPPSSGCVSGYCIAYDNDLLGDGCYNNNDCKEEFMKSMSCVKSSYGNYCQCPPGFVLGNTDCLPKRKIGESCESIAQCQFPGTCRNGVCECREDTWYTRKGDDCVRRKAGDSCEHLYNCGANTGGCVNGSCICSEGYNNKEGICVETKIGDSCEETRDCPQRSMCYLGKCVCLADYEVNDAHKCVPKHVGGHCEEIEDCPVRGFCEYGTCVCKRSYVQKNFECVMYIPNWGWYVIFAVGGFVFVSVIVTIVICWKRNRNRRKKKTVPTISSIVDSKYLACPTYDKFY